MPAVPTRLNQGLSTALADDFLGMFPIPQNIQCNYYFNDFNTYAAADWTVTSTGGGTNALQALNGGSLLVTTGGTDGNDQGLTLLPASFAITRGCQAWFAISYSVSNATTSTLITGLTNGGPDAPTDGVYFTKAGGATAISAVIRASSTSTTLASITTQQAAKMTLGWYYDGRPTDASISFWSSYGLTASAAKPKFGGNMVERTTTMTNLPAVGTVLAPQFYLTTASGSVAKTAGIDWMLAAVEIPEVLMATLTKNVTFDGQRATAMFVNVLCDDGDLALQTLVDVSALVPPATKIRVDEIEYAVDGGLSVNLYWEGASSNSPLVSLTGQGEFEAEEFGSIQNDAVGPTGNIMIETNGWSLSGGDLVASFALKLVKQNF